MLIRRSATICRVWRQVVFCLHKQGPNSAQSPRRLFAFLVLLMALSFGIWKTVGSLIVFTSRFKSFCFDWEPRLSLGEAAVVAAAHPLPDDASITVPLRVTKKIHFMYRIYLLDEQLKPFLVSWRTVYPDYKIYFWTDREINELVRRRYPAWKDLYHRQLSNYLERSDTARAFILSSFGGWYADLDAGSLRRADEVAAAHALVLPLEPYVHAFDNFNKRRLVSNAIMYSAPRHPFWVYFLERLKASLVGREARKSTLEAVYVTGPVMLTETTLLFMQAHLGTGCPRGRWCPHLAKPVSFLPIYDNHSNYLRDQLQLYCKYTFTHPDFSEDCERFKSHDYRNYLESSVSYAYHSFLHLNEKRGSARRKSDVRVWGLELTVGEQIIAELI